MKQKTQRPLSKLLNGYIPSNLIIWSRWQTIAFIWRWPYVQIRLKEHEKGVFTPVITFVSPNTNRTLIALLKEIQNIKSQMTINIAELNAACNDRFNWSEVDSQLSAMPTIDTSLEGFWAKIS